MSVGYSTVLVYLMIAVKFGLDGLVLALTLRHIKPELPKRYVAMSAAVWSIVFLLNLGAWRVFGGGFFPLLDSRNPSVCYSGGG